MLKKEFIICVLTVSFFLGLFGTAFAGENDYISIIGSDKYQFDAPESTSVMVESNYDQEHLAAVATEAGVLEFKFDAPETKADVAARNYNYDQVHLALIGTEAGNSEFRGHDATMAGGNRGAVCSNC